MWESCSLAFPCAVNRVIHDGIACYAHFHNAIFKFRNIIDRLFLLLCSDNRISRYRLCNLNILIPTMSILSTKHYVRFISNNLSPFFLCDILFIITRKGEYTVMVNFLRLYIINSFFQSSIFDSLIYPLLVGLLLFFLEYFFNKKMADVDKHFAQFFNEYFIKYIQKKTNAVYHICLSTFYIASRI